MNAKADENNEIHLLRDAVIAVIDMADDADSDQVKLAMDTLLASNPSYRGRHISTKSLFSPSLFLKLPSSLKSASPIASGSATSQMTTP